MNSKTNQISRYGAYGILLQNSKILLTRKKSGPYTGLWDLPGGGIEFGETPEDALRRELLEESSLAINQFDLSSIATSTGKYASDKGPYEFHHIGFIYKVFTWSEQPDLIPEEENHWASLNNLNLDELTPFTKHAVNSLPKNQGWRPQKSIRGKVIGLAKHENQLLVFEVLDDEGALKGWCPLGGGIEFGETAEAALKREFQEELGCNIRITANPIVWENIFEHHEAKGHEIIFAFPILFDDPQIYSKHRFSLSEGAATHWAEWIPIEHFKTGKSILFPPALLEKIDAV